MTLHDRIMRMDVGALSGDNSFHEGVTAAKFKAAQLATEADELMAEMAEALELLRHEVIASGNYSAGDFGWPCATQKTDAALSKYNTYKERNNEQ